ncbi:MAG: hypothetical protein FJ265_22685, partial [Planctomycetes bacterium]|nr:hypothetical protein [Planctomycetota bacterium]
MARTPGITLLLLLAGAAPVAAQAELRGPVLLVPMPAAAGWQDLAFLAALPAAAAQRSGAPLVLAVAANGELTPEQRDFLRRARPGRLLWVGAAPATLDVDGVPGECLAADTADAVAAALAQRSFPTGPRAVVVPEADYRSALAGAVLAARLPAPLLFCGKSGVSDRTKALLEGLSLRSLLLVGDFGPAKVAVAGATNETLREPADVARWLEQHGLPVGYLAAAASADRERGHVRKLSLAAAALAP